MTASSQNERAIFLAALDHTPGVEREAYLCEACHGQRELLNRVRTLLAAHEGPDGPLDVPPSGLDPTPPTALAPLEAPGTQIGPYKLLEQIGEGGFGVVYMAEQHQPVRRSVALKVIKPGMDTRQVIARFEAERQALAVMDHSNIARVLDAGTTSSGRPYFVMDLVRGVPITRYCDEQHLTLQQRLELFVPVCQAIQHAHQKGIIHRDIKPTNVLVALSDGVPVPKVIDFGVAKATEQRLTERTTFTQVGQLVGTLEYMSPEQAELNQHDMDTRSDIYSLGVLLFELLTGTTPLEKERLRAAAFDEILRIIREEEPPTPSARLTVSEMLPSIAANRSVEPARLGKAVRGELDWIVMKALEKDRGRRYETASAMAADLQRYLNDEPVLACPPSVVYRFRKFIRRNKRALLTIAVIAMAALFAVGAIGWSLRDRAGRQAKVAEQVELILTDVDRLEREQKWPEALVAARRAEAAAAGGDADSSTMWRIRDRLKDLEFIDRLEQIRMQRATTVEGQFDFTGTVREYSRAFRLYGVDVERIAAETSIDRLKARPTLAIPLAAALDCWAYDRRGESRTDIDAWKRLVAVARGIDPEPLRNRIRATWGQPMEDVQNELCPLADSIDISGQHPATLVLLSWSLKGATPPWTPEETKRPDSAALRFLRDAQQAFPGDFWLNFELGYLLSQQKDYEGAVRFYTAAVSIRPHSAAALVRLSLALARQGMGNEARAAYRKAIEIDPTYVENHTNFDSDVLLQGYLKGLRGDFKSQGREHQSRLKSGSAKE